MVNEKWPPTFVEGFHNEDSVRQMEYRKLGGTDLFVSKMSLGGGPFGGLYNSCDQNTVNNIVLESLKNGVNLIDTSYWYGQGRSEKALGEALKDIPRSAYYIATKVCRYEKDYKHMFDFTAARTQRQIDDALERLRLPYVDILFIHDFEFCDNENTIINETLPVLQKAKESGKARYIGITGYPLGQMKSVIEKSKIPIDAILTYSRATLHDSSLRYHVPFFRSKNVGIINAAATSMGLLTPGGPQNWHPATDRIKKASKAAADYCKMKTVDIAKLATHESVNFPGVATTAIGMDNPRYVHQNLQATWGYLSDDERRCLNDIMGKYFLPLNDENWEDKAMNEYKMKLQETDDSTWT